MRPHSSHLIQTSHIHCTIFNTLSLLHNHVCIGMSRKTCCWRATMTLSCSDWTRRGGEDRTPRRTHIFSQCRALNHRSSHAPACGSSLGCVALLRNLSWMCLTPFPSFCSTPPPTTQTSLPTTGVRRSPCATSHGGFQCGRLVEPYR